MLRELAKLYAGLLFRDGHLTDVETLRHLARDETTDDAKKSGCSPHGHGRKSGSHYWRPRWIW